MALIKDYLKKSEEHERIYGKNSIVLMQVGQFFEMYGLRDSATKKIVGSSIQDISQKCDLSISNKKVCVGKHGVVMSGFPEFGLEKYLKKIQDHGYTVAIYVQDAQTKNTTRSLLGIFSPGTYFATESTEISNHIISIWIEKLRSSVINKSGKPSVYIGLSTVDIYTGKSYMFESQEQHSHSPSTFDEIERFVSIYKPNEVIITYRNFSESEITDIINFSGIRCESIRKVDVDEKNNKMCERAKNSEKQSYQKELLQRFYSVPDIDSFYDNFYNFPMASNSFCFLLDYIYSHNPSLVSKIAEPLFENSSKNLMLANHSINQLNINETHLSSGVNKKLSCVLNFLNRCTTPMGKRRFNYNLMHPTTCVETLQREYDIIEYFLENFKQLDFIYTGLSDIKDIEKLNRKIILRKITPQALYQFYKNLESIKQIYKQVKKDTVLTKYLQLHVKDNIDKNCNQFIKLFDKTIDIKMCKDIDTLYFETNFMKRGVFPELDRHVQKHIESKDMLEVIRKYLDQFVARSEKKTAKKKTTEYVKNYETEKLGFSLVTTKRRSLFLLKELEKEQKECEAVELSYVSSYSGEEKSFEFDISNITCYTTSASNQTITNTTLRTICSDITSSKNKMKDELTIQYNRFIENLETYQNEFLNIINYVTVLDMIHTKSYIAKKNKYCKPEIQESDKSFVDIKGLRHCLIEHLQTNELYVTNDVCLGKDTNGILLYGTNAVGKTSFIKSLGISVIMAQAGLYVPCTEFTYSPYSAIFTRILGNDNIFKGLSTFAVEMTELRTILRMSTERSLILGDELCSGTESDSAISIFVAGLMKLHKNNSSFIFATHFHEIVNFDEIAEMERLKMMHMTVIYDKERDILQYDRKLKDGPGESMYGLEVCKSLSLPADFLDQAYQIRNKYNKKTQGLMSQKVSRYNSSKIKQEMCEICNMQQACDTHHLQYQQDADEDDMIITNQITFHKNHKSNLASVCKSCHDRIHNKNIRMKRVKTSDGYKFHEI